MHHPTGRIDAEGNYQIYTNRKLGAPTGWYRVLVFAQASDDKSGRVHPGMPRWLVPKRYTTFENTDLRVEVKENAAPGAFDLDLAE
jgi:hypothetical protein